MTESTCLICLEDYATSGPRTVTYGCGHKFHSKCLFAWLDTLPKNDNTSRCPQCRQVVIEWPRTARPYYRRQQQQQESSWIRWVVYVTFVILMMNHWAEIVIFTPVDHNKMSVYNETRDNRTSLVSFVHKVVYNSYLKYNDSCAYMTIYAWSGVLYSLHLMEISTELFHAHLLWNMTDSGWPIDEFMHRESLFIANYTRYWSSKPVMIEEQLALVWQHTTTSKMRIRDMIQSTFVLLLYIGHTIILFLVAYIVAPIGCMLGLAPCFSMIPLTFDVIELLTPVYHEAYQCMLGGQSPCSIHVLFHLDAKATVNATLLYFNATLIVLPFLYCLFFTRPQ